MTILICTRTPQELKACKENIKSLKLKMKLPLHYLCLGEDNYESIFQLTQFLCSQKELPSFIINIGCYKGNEKAVPIQIGRIKNLNTGKELLPPLPFSWYTISSVFSGEQSQNNTTDSEKIPQDKNARALEMIAQRFNIPRLLLRIPQKENENADSSPQELANQFKKHLDREPLLKKILQSY